MVTARILCEREFSASIEYWIVGLGESERRWRGAPPEIIHKCDTLSHHCSSRRPTASSQAQRERHLRATGSLVLFAVLGRYEGPARIAGATGSGTLLLMHKHQSKIKASPKFSFIRSSRPFEEVEIMTLHSFQTESWLRTSSLQIICLSGVNLQL